MILLLIQHDMFDNCLSTVSWILNLIFLSNSTSHKPSGRSLDRILRPIQTLERNYFQTTWFREEVSSQVWSSMHLQLHFDNVHYTKVFQVWKTQFKNLCHRKFDTENLLGRKEKAANVACLSGNQCDRNTLARQVGPLTSPRLSESIFVAPL